MKQIHMCSNGTEADVQQKLPQSVAIQNLLRSYYCIYIYII